MDIYEYLKKDHEKVANLFKQFENSPTSDHKLAFVNLLIRELIVHAESEQRTFYKYLEQFEESREIALHGQEEHNEIETLISTINKMKTLNKAWIDKVEKLKEIVEHHVKDEEGKMFRAAKKVLTEADALKIKEQMHYLKGKLLEKYDK